MNNSIFWARLLGLYTVILVLGMFLDIKNYQTLLTDMANNHSLLMTMGIFGVFLGLAIVVNHQVWRGWPIIVTVVGYWITIKGIILLYFPNFVNKVIAFWQDKNMYFAPLPALTIGLILLYCGFFLHHKEN